jgi:RNA-splicing ligase RtcB
MQEIRGKKQTALCFASVIEDEAVRQIRDVLDSPAAEGSKIRIMPDAHAGKGCVIGTTMTLTDKVVPNLVGVDIGCGMYTVRLRETEADLRKVDAAAHRIPSGMHVWDEAREMFPLEYLRCFQELRDTDWIRRSLGTLGGGNHFIEIDRTDNGSLYLVIHSGSRNLGCQVARIYQKKAVQSVRKGDYAAKAGALIARLKAEGRQRDIEPALAALKKETGRSIPDDLCYLAGQGMDDYLHDLFFCQTFAVRNRELMADMILADAGLTAADRFHTVHNYIDQEDMILRKGAIRARKGERVLIPLNMRDGSLLAVGKGNPDWNCSAPHGAGRVMSRKKAKETLSLADYKASMTGIYSTSVSMETIDEAPMAYKPAERIAEDIRDTVDVVGRLRPVYNFKAES